mgnify:CR=1 FL=1
MSGDRIVVSRRVFGPYVQVTSVFSRVGNVWLEEMELNTGLTGGEKLAVPVRENMLVAGVKSSGDGNPDKVLVYCLDGDTWEVVAEVRLPYG